MDNQTKIVNLQTFCGYSENGNTAAITHIEPIYKWLIVHHYVNTHPVKIKKVH